MPKEIYDFNFFITKVYKFVKSYKIVIVAFNASFSSQSKNVKCIKNPFLYYLLMLHFRQNQKLLSVLKTHFYTNVFNIVSI